MKKGIIGIIMVLGLGLVLVSGCGGGTKKVDIPPPTELLTNGGFESGSLELPWEALGAATVINTGAHSGTYCVQVNVSADWHGVQQDITQVLNDNGPGTYHVEYWAKLASGGSNTFMIMWGRTTEAGGAGMEFSAFPDSHPNVTDQWTKVEANINMTWSGTLTKSYIAVKQDAAGSYSTLYIDDFSMTKVN